MSRDPKPPIFVGEVRVLGFPLNVSCAICNRSTVLPIDVAKDLPDEATMQHVAKRLRCSRCNLSPGAGVSVQPHPRLWVAHLRQSGQDRAHLPYWAPMMPEGEDAEALAAFSERGALPK
jgi:hypothetical protein